MFVKRKITAFILSIAAVMSMGTVAYAIELPFIPIEDIEQSGDSVSSESEIVTEEEISVPEIPVDSESEVELPIIDIEEGGMILGEDGKSEDDTSAVKAKVTEKADNKKDVTTSAEVESETKAETTETTIKKSDEKKEESKETDKKSPVIPIVIASVAVIAAIGIAVFAASRKKKK